MTLHTKIMERTRFMAILCPWTIACDQ